MNVLHSRGTVVATGAAMGAVLGVPLALGLHDPEKNDLKPLATVSGGLLGVAGLTSAADDLRNWGNPGHKVGYIDEGPAGMFAQQRTKVRIGIAMGVVGAGLLIGNIVASSSTPD